MESILTIDGAGRLVIPKAMRERLRLKEGARIRLREEDGDKLILEPVAESASLRESNGLLVVRGSVKGTVPDHRDLRANRVRDLARART